jgi:hypothetical protein
MSSASTLIAACEQHTGSDTARLQLLPQNKHLQDVRFVPDSALLRARVSTVGQGASSCLLEHNLREYAGLNILHLFIVHWAVHT